MATNDIRSLVTEEEREEKLKLLQDTRADLGAGKISKKEAAGVLAEVIDWAKEHMTYEFSTLFGNRESNAGE